MFARAGRKKPDMVRILHAADFHLDSAYGALTAEQAVQLAMNEYEGDEAMIRAQVCGFVQAALEFQILKEADEA